MSGTLDVEIRWGGGRWQRGQKNAAKPYVETAVSLVRDAFNYFSIESHVPKIATIWQMSRTWPNGGESYDATHFDLNIARHDLRHRNVGRRMVSLSALAVHEAAHCVRFERFPSDKIAELIATEGIAYTLSGAFTEAIGLDDSFASRLVNGVRKMDPECIEEFIKTLSVDSDNDGNTSDELEVVWMDNIGDRLAPGSILGMHCVIGLLQEGVSWPDIFAMTAEDIIYNHAPRRVS